MAAHLAAATAAARRASRVALTKRDVLLSSSTHAQQRFYSNNASSSAAAAAADTPGAIFKTSIANKTGLSHALDGVMRSGAHDMKVFGTGTLAALTSKTAYAKSAAAHYPFYAEMERQLDAAAEAGTPSGKLWSKFADELRRAPALEEDLRELLGKVAAIVCHRSTTRTTHA